MICPPARARAKGLTSTVCFPTGNLAPFGSVIKATAIDPRVVGADGVYNKSGPVRMFTTERAVIRAIKGLDQPAIQPGEIIVLAGRGPMGSGMEEVYQVTSALRHLPFGHEVALITDARFSGVSTGACIGHVSPEALAGGPIGRLRDGDTVTIRVDQNDLTASVDLTGHGEETWTVEEAESELASRSMHPDVAPDPRLPEDTRLWAALQEVGGGLWGGCVYDPDAIIERLGG